MKPKPPSESMSLEQYKEMTKPKKKSKYNNVRTEVDGIKFPSKKQAAYYQKLKLARETGELGYFLMEVPFKLPGGVTYRADFIEFWKHGDGYKVVVTDVKGMLTSVYKLKKKQVEALYGIKINEV
jgi:hypothetical protein